MVTLVIPEWVLWIFFILWALQTLANAALAHYHKKYLKLREERDGSPDPISEFLDTEMRIRK